jgi:hypothetical protein
MATAAAALEPDNPSSKTNRRNDAFFTGGVDIYDGEGAQQKRSIIAKLVADSRIRLVEDQDDDCNGTADGDNATEDDFDDDDGIALVADSSPIVDTDVDHCYDVGYKDDDDDEFDDDDDHDLVGDMSFCNDVAVDVDIDIDCFDLPPTPRRSSPLLVSALSMKAFDALPMN